MKKCSKCGETKELSEFFNNKVMSDGKSNYCKKCHSEEAKSRKEIYKEKKYYLNRKEKASEYGKKYYQENKERLSEIRKVYREKNKEKQRELSKKWYENNKEYKLLKNSENEKYQRIHNPLFRVKKNLRSRISNALNGKIKFKGTIQLLGCSIDELKVHLEKQFDENMNWENYGMYWHVDHIKPCSLFNLLNENEQMECFHYSNLQPLEASENLKKYNNFNMDENKNE